MNIAFLAHDKKKELIVQFCTAYKSVLAKHDLCATATTDGSRITIPFPFTYTNVFAVPRSIPKSRITHTSPLSCAARRILFIHSLRFSR